MKDNTLEQSVEMIMKAIRDSNQDRVVMLKELRRANRVLEYKNSLKRKKVA